MGRRRRQFDPALFHHVTSRGNNRERVFFDDADRTACRTMLARAVTKYRLVLIAWCFIDNHIHLVVRAPDGGISRAMQELLTGYSCRTNVRYGRSGHLWRYRFFARAVTTDAGIREVCRYVDLNPVRAGLCSAPDEYAWSSYRASAGYDIAPRWHAVGELHAVFGKTPAAAARAYRQYVREALSRCRTPGQGPPSHDANERRRWC